tara:strand:+ start:53 stop:256 length:204 start_codon:yes stop_codon:yes gene_type:complete
MNSRFHDLVVTHWGARFMGRNLPVAIGRSGIAEKICEGDGITPQENISLRLLVIATIAYLLNPQMLR